MRAVPAIFDNGRIFFSFCLPHYEGPVSVLVIFPDVDDYDIIDPGPEDLDGMAQLEKELALKISVGFCGVNIPEKNLC